MAVLEEAVPPEHAAQGTQSLDERLMKLKHKFERMFESLANKLAINQVTAPSTAQQKAGRGGQTAAAQEISIPNKGKRMVSGDRRKKTSSGKGAQKPSFAEEQEVVAVQKGLRPLAPQQPNRPVKPPLPLGPHQGTLRQGNYHELLDEARSKINPGELGFTTGFKPKRAQTGALIIEVPGKDSSAKADLLANHLAKVFEGRPGVKIARPTKTGEIRILDLTDSATAEELVVVIAEVESCVPKQVQVGPLVKGPNGLFTAWARCLLTAVSAIQKAGNKLMVG
ncbi:uncharacterized protein LOC112467568 [Temnothorax curvispinosus]|uniref:Uncharacterized protein LOC112467568 n=1 Tax=Temnothorax curvispinosus TaxID=300111 RepID=A0A6J1RH12_9HYME|nr:uncharacterized protein LOC112467568 [Temnothorax curvispinosus]